MPSPLVRQDRKALRRAVAAAAGVVLVAMAASWAGLGCSRPVTADAWYGPFGPVELPPKLVKTVLSQVLKMGPGQPVNPAPDSWPLQVEFRPRAEVFIVQVWPEGVLVDNQPQGTAEDGRALAAEVRSSVLAGLPFADAFKAAESATLTPRDG